MPRRLPDESPFSLPEEFPVGASLVEVDAFGASFVGVDELGVVDPEEVEDGGVDVVDVEAVLDGVEAQFVGRRRTVWPSWTPPPAIHMVKAVGLWSRPSPSRASGCARTRRPRSRASRRAGPRWSRSLISAAIGGRSCRSRS